MEGNRAVSLERELTTEIAGSPNTLDTPPGLARISGGQVQSTASTVLHSRPEVGCRIKHCDSVLIVTPNSKLLGSLAKAGLVPTQLTPDAATRASVFDPANFAIQNGEIGMVWVGIIKIQPHFAQSGRQQKSHENRYYSRILTLLASAVRRGTPVILVEHNLGA